ncbi:TolC family protein [Undibacterium sp.]|uniref:TolC family protein n=1 Tax=Undibacterium sp. TaxID=1914977 RepID=UPI0025E90C85|nr:TolC family protein [Undibacterium sp.]
MKPLSLLLFVYKHKPSLASISLSLSLSFSAVNVYAATVAPDLRGASELAWKLHPEAAALDARDTQARAAQELADNWTPEPAAISVSSRNDRLNSNLGQQEYEVELATPLWLPGQRAARSAEASARIDEAKNKRAALRWEVAGNVREVWWTLATARNLHQLATRRLETASALDIDIQRRYQLGDVSRIDSNLARTEVHVAQAELIETEMTLSQSEQAFTLLTGATAPVIMSQEQLTNLSNQRSLADTPLSHPLLARAASAVSSALARAKVAEQAQRAAPELALRMQRERAGAEQPYANSVGIRLKIPFSSGAQTRELSAAARAESLQAEAEMWQLKTKVQLNLEQLYRLERSQQRQLEIAQQSHELSIDNLKLAEKAFKLGETDLSSLLRIRSTAFGAEALLERQRLANAALTSRLNQALGVLP